MRELSIFVDESGDFGEYSHFCPYYIVTLITHEQENLINEQIEKLNLHFSIENSGIQAMHTAPLIRKENVYKDLDVTKRRKMFNSFFHFTRKIGIKYKNIIVDKKHKNSLDINSNISINLSTFVKENSQQI